MIYIRTDMNPVIATGHMMRCLSIADGAGKLGAQTTFILSDENGRELVEGRGHRAVVLNCRWDEPMSGLDKLIALIQKEQISQLLIDSYYVTAEYLAALREHVFVSYIDDINAFHYPVDEIICYANYHDQMGYDREYPKVHKCLGTQYAPLRQEYADCPSKFVRERVESILIMSGGSDPCDALRRIVQSMPQGKYRKVTVICGAYYPFYEELLKLSETRPELQVLRSQPDIKSYMEEADVAITAAGSTLYELCAVGTPAISYTFADNQMPNARSFDRDGIIPYAGDFRTEDISRRLWELLECSYREQSKRRKISAVMQSKVDGHGAVRIAGQLLNHTKE